MKKKYKITLLIAIPLFLISTFIILEVYLFFTKHSIDSSFVLVNNIPSPDNKHRIIEYKYDTGAFGYTRTWWAITPYKYKYVNLDKYNLPDGYIADGWSDQNEVLINIWEPYYGRKEIINLKTGDLFKGVKLLIIEEPNKSLN